MKTSLFTAALAATTFVLAAGAAPAEATDADGDGRYSLAELLAAYPELAEADYALIDANGDGAVDADELRAAEASGLIGG